MRASVMYRTPATAAMVVAGLLVALAAMLWVGPAEAAFPGRNGKIAFTSDRDGNFEIYTMNADGSGKGNLTNHPNFDRYPAWSPDGSKIAFMSDRDGEYEIYTMDAEDGSGVERLTNDSAFDSDPDWQPLPPSPPPIDVDPILPAPPICSSSRAWWCELLINDPIIRRVPQAPGLIIRDHVPPSHLTPIKALVRDKQTDLEKEDIQLFVDGIRESDRPTRRTRTGSPTPSMNSPWANMR